MLCYISLGQLNSRTGAVNQHFIQYLPFWMDFPTGFPLCCTLDLH